MRNPHLLFHQLLKRCKHVMEGEKTKWKAKTPDPGRFPRSPSSVSILGSAYGVRSVYNKAAAVIPKSHRLHLVVDNSPAGRGESRHSPANRSQPWPRFWQPSPTTPYARLHPTFLTSIQKRRWKRAAPRAALRIPSTPSAPRATIPAVRGQTPPQSPTKAGGIHDGSD
jgi:hypothetical protein